MYISARAFKRIFTCKIFCCDTAENEPCEVCRIGAQRTALCDDDAELARDFPIGLPRVRGGRGPRRLRRERRARPDIRRVAVPDVHAPVRKPFKFNSFFVCGLRKNCTN